MIRFYNVRCLSFYYSKQTIIKSAIISLIKSLKCYSFYMFETEPGTFSSFSGNSLINKSSFIGLFGSMLEGINPSFTLI